jgi:hypothetical protein
MEHPQEISIATICHGGVPEVFDRELTEVLNNILDVNTDVGKARTLTLKFTFAPLEDRSGATVTFSCRAGLQPVQVAKSPIFLSRQTGTVKAYALDQQQVDLFGASAPSDSKLTMAK